MVACMCACRRNVAPKLTPVDSFALRAFLAPLLALDPCTTCASMSDAILAQAPNIRWLTGKSYPKLAAPSAGGLVAQISTGGRKAAMLFVRYTFPA